MPRAKFFWLVLLVILTTSPTTAQEMSPRDSLEQEIRAHPETDVVLLGKTRAVLLENIKRERERTRLLVPLRHLMRSCSDVLHVHP